MINAATLVVSISILMVGLTAISSTYNLATSAHAAADSLKWCYFHPFNHQRECFHSRGECEKAFKSDPLAQAGCTKQ
ncbi:MAG TPA: hypothetical protein VJ729_14790 [Nitrososphaeraceae archaeon]|nr:hypothetical protein [Nitrososphaeraceae archaeon]